MSYLPRSSRERIEAADIRETSCSPDRPPNITPTRTLGMLRSNCQVSPFADQFNFGFEHHAELIMHGRAGQVHQRFDIGRLRRRRGWYEKLRRKHDTRSAFALQRARTIAVAQVFGRDPGYKSGGIRRHLLISTLQDSGHMKGSAHIPAKRTRI